MGGEYRYRYTTENGDPLEVCPECGHDLTDTNNGVHLSIVVAGQPPNRDITSYLDPDGYLEDTEDGAVAKGFHSDTRCGGCGESLSDMTGVVEDDGAEDDPRDGGMLELPYLGARIEFDGEGGATITSDLSGSDETDDLKVAYDTIEGMILALACEGVDVGTVEFKNAIESVVGKVTNTYGD